MNYDHVESEWLRHSQGQRTNTDAVILRALSNSHNIENITIISERHCDILAYAKAGHVKVDPIVDHDAAPVKWRIYTPPASRVDGSAGSTNDHVLYGKYNVHWKSHTFLWYIADGRDGNSGYPITRNNYIVTEAKDVLNELILAAGQYANQLHGEIWVYDQGMWHKDAKLWSSIQHAEWENVILDASMKTALIADTNRFYNTKSTYQHLGVPWRRGIIFHGPPGNGKTISIKATMHMLYNRKDPIPTIYVKTLTNYRGPEASLNDIFAKARSEAPCYLVFEDLDSLVTDQVRSFFLNQVDGLSSNDGILMIGSTNHLERLDPGISKRPSRFDRIYYFPNPNHDQRVQYAEYWRNKLHKANKDPEGGDDFPDIEFPRALCSAIADITDDFSFAYIQEAFLATLLKIAGGTSHDEAAGPGRQEEGSTDNDDFNKYLLWRELKKQVKVLREQLGSQTIRSATSSQDRGSGRLLAQPIQGYAMARPVAVHNPLPGRAAPPQ